jgi:hypothetical protein
VELACILFIFKIQKRIIAPLSYQEDSIAQGFQGYSSPFSLSQRKFKILVTLLEMQVA